MNLEELKAQIKELDDTIDLKRRELDELISFRSSIAGNPAPANTRPVLLPDPPKPGDVIPANQWTPEMQAALRAEEARVKEYARFNKPMPLPAARVQTQQVQVPQGMIPADMQKWLEQ